MSTEQSDVAGGTEQLSALVDGELAPEAVTQVCKVWRGDEASRRTWHTYHLIGDVLRSDDLASVPARDEAFLQRLRVRLAEEPVVLAPQPVNALPMAAARSLRRWRTGAAVAAGFVVVAGALVALQMPSRDEAPALAQAQPTPPVPAAAVVPVVAATPVVAGVADPVVLVTDGRVIRDARLDRYLAAHQRFAGAGALDTPSVFLRNATATADGAQR